MNILVFGAGVLGSLYAARLQEAGNEVTLVARGQRFCDLLEQGIVLEEFSTGRQSVTPVRTVDRVPVDEPFDLCLVCVQKTQVPGALEALRKARQIPLFLWIHNSAEGFEDLTAVLGRDRVMIGHANAGGERDGHMIRYTISQKMTLGELDGTKTPRVREIAQVMKSAGFPAVISRDIDAWKRYHVALAVPFAGAMYEHGCCNLQMAESSQGVRKCLAGIRETMAVLKSLNHRPEPAVLSPLMALPDGLLCPLFRKMLRSEVADIGMARHLRNARAEMAQLARELQVLMDNSSVSTPVLMPLTSRVIHEGQTQAVH